MLRVLCLQGMAALAFRSSVPQLRLVSRRLALPPHLEEAKQLLEKDEAMLLDVRELDEWNEGHFADATLVPYVSKLALGDGLPEELATSTKKIIVHCKAGGRAKKAAEMLTAGGVDAVALEEGFDTLNDLNFADVAK